MNDFIFIDQDINKLKEEIYTNKSDLFKRLIDQCSTYFEYDLPKEHPKKSTTYMGIAIANLALAYILTEEKKYLDEAKRWIFTCVNYPHWGNAFLVDVDLSAAWILFGFGIAYDWLKKDLSIEEKNKIKDKIILQGNRMYDFKIKTEGEGWSTNYWQNHNWINLTGLSTAGYALVDEYDMAANWIKTAKENFEFVYSVLPKDGSDYEGVVYWRYGVMWLFIYAHLIKEREGIDYFKSCDFLKNTFYYRLYQAAPNLEEQINFGDCHDRRSGHSTAIYYKVAKEYRNGHAQKMGNLVRTQFLEKEAKLSAVKPGILPECFFELLFYDDTVDEKDFDDLELTKYFEDLGLVVIRSSWEKDAIHFSFKTSYPGGKTQWKNLWKLKEEKGYNCFGLSHQHPDNNSFILNAYNKYLAIDDGYNRNVKASDHNVVIVDGKGYEDENQNNIWKKYTKDQVGEIEKYINEGSYVYIIGETSKLYKKELQLQRFARHILYTRKNYFIILDELESSNDHTYTWIMHSDVFPEVDQNKFIYKNGSAYMQLYNVSPVKTEYKLLDNYVRAIMTTQEPDKYREIHMKSLYVSNVEKMKNMNFLNVLIVDDHENDKYEIIKINTSEVIGVTIKSEEFVETFLYSKDNSNRIKYNNKVYNSNSILIKTNENLIEEVITL